MRSLRNDFYANLILPWHARRTCERRMYVTNKRTIKLLVFIRSSHFEVFLWKLISTHHVRRACLFFDLSRSLFTFKLFIHTLFFVSLSLSFFSIFSSLSLSLSLILHFLAHTFLSSSALTYTYNSCQHIFLSVGQSGVVKEYEQANI